MRSQPQQTWGSAWRHWASTQDCRIVITAHLRNSKLYLGLFGRSVKHRIMTYDCLGGGRGGYEWGHPVINECSLLWLVKCAGHVTLATDSSQPDPFHASTHRRILWDIKRTTLQGIKLEGSYVYLEDYGLPGWITQHAKKKGRYRPSLWHLVNPSGEMQGASGTDLTRFASVRSSIMC